MRKPTPLSGSCCVPGFPSFQAEHGELSCSDPPYHLASHLCPRPLALPPPLQLSERLETVRPQDHQADHPPKLLSVRATREQAVLGGTLVLE